MPLSLALLQRLARLPGGVAVLGIIVLPVIPGELRPQSGFPSIAEHFIFYLGGAGLLAFGYEKWVSAGVVVLVLSLAAVILELSQLVIPHRDANLLDVLVSAGGAITGAGIARVFAYVWRQYLH